MTPCCLRLRRARRRAFTLVELLVAVGLTSLLMWGILQLYSSATRFSSTMFTEADLVAGGRAALDRMCSELACAAPLDVGYLWINNDSAPTQPPTARDFIQFVAPIGEGGKLVHVKYLVDNEGMLRRAINDTTATTADPTTVTFPTEGNPAREGTPLGVTADSLNITYINFNSTIIQGDTDQWRDPDLTDATVPRLPRAVLIELTAKDVKTSIMVTLSSGAYLVGSGI